MTISELAIKLGFQVQGQSQFDKAVKELGFAEIKAYNLKLAIAGLGTAFLGLMYFATTAANGLYKFHQTTGLSTRGFQQMRYAMAGFNVSTEELMNTLEGIQDAQLQIAMGSGDLRPWTFFGIQPGTMDALQVMWKVHQAIMARPWATVLNRNMASAMGFGGNIFAALSDKNLKFDDLNKFIIGPEQQAAAHEMAASLDRISLKLAAVGTKFALVFGPKITDILTNLLGPLSKVADYVDRLTAHGDEGERLRKTWIHWAEGIGTVVTALTALNVVARSLATIAAFKTIFSAAAGVAGSAAGAAGIGLGGAAIGATGIGAIVAGITGFLINDKTAKNRIMADMLAKGFSPRQAQEAVDSTNVLSRFWRDLFPHPSFGLGSQLGTGGNTEVHVTQYISGSDPHSIATNAVNQLKGVVNELIFRPALSYVGQSAQAH